LALSKEAILVRATPKQIYFESRDDAPHRPSLKEIEARRGFRDSENETDLPSGTRSRLVDVLGTEYPVPDWLITEDYKDEVLGTIKSGKEGSVYLVERSAPHRSHNLALKAYKDPNTRSFHRDQIYREGRKFRESRESKAVERRTGFGRELMASQWQGVEFEILRRLWAAGVSVPYPVEELGSRFLMQYIGDETRAAPRLVDFRPSVAQAESYLDQILENMVLMASEGYVHGDLSAYNVLIWEDKVWVIDLPQAVDLASNPHSMDLLQRDLDNVCTYFHRKFGLERDPGEEMAKVVAVAV
jgi:RIO kinase 1